MRAGYLFWRVLLLVAGGAIVAVSGWIWHLTRPRTIDVGLPPCLPIIRLNGNDLVVQTRADALLAQVDDFKSEVEAYLYFEYLKTHVGLASSDVLLTLKNTGMGPRYQIFLVLENNLLWAVPYLNRIQVEGYIPDYSLCKVTYQDLARKRLETAVFQGCYDPLTTRRLASIPAARLLIPLTHFLMFKSRTDRRVRLRIWPVPTTLSYPQAEELAKDILDVTRFYHLPLPVFLGIGAMENDYMNIRGDLAHAIWKRWPQRGDIVLKRANGLYLVSDYAMGVWQITRDTLRYAHELYLQDARKRNYSLLPPRLRPAKKLSFDLDNSEVLTTYAGMILRHLLDKTHGDIAEAVGAYNGGLMDPNYQYAAGVEAVASYARSFLERAANLDGMNVVKLWLAHRASVTTDEEVATNRPESRRKDSNRPSE